MILAENPLFSPDFPDWKKSSKISLIFLISLIGGNPDFLWKKTVESQQKFRTIIIFFPIKTIQSNSNLHYFSIFQAAEPIPEATESVVNDTTLFMYKTGEYENVTTMKVGSRMSFLLAAQVSIILTMTISIKFPINFQFWISNF